MLALRMKKAVRNGATLVVADPRKIWLTKIAKRHLQLRPGSDVWLINAMPARDLRGRPAGRRVHRRAHGGVETSARSSRATRPEDGREVTGVPAEDIRATAREYATERHAAIFYTLGITEHACAVDNIWSLSNLVLVDRPLGYESTGLNALRGQNNVQGLNDSGANPAYYPGYQAGGRPGGTREVRGGVGHRLPATPGYRLDQIISGLHDGRTKALYLVGENPGTPSRTRSTSRRGFEHLEFVVAQDLFLNELDREYADVVFPASSFAEKDGTFTNTERRVNRVRAGGAAARARRGSTGEIVIELARAIGRLLARVPGRRGGLERARRPLARTGTASATTGSRSRACSGRASTATTRARSSSTPRPSRPDGKGKLWPVEYQPPIELPDADYPLDALHRPDALPLQLGDDDDAGGRASPTSRRIRSSRSRPRTHLFWAWPRATGPASSRAAATSRPRAKITDRVYPGLVWMALHFAAGEGELADPRRRRPADRHAGVSRSAPSASSRSRLAAPIRRRGLRGGGRQHRAVRIRAAVLEEFGQPLVVQELELGEPKAGEALVRLAACGVCHTDLYAASGADPTGYSPCVLGHEGARGGREGRRGRPRSRRARRPRRHALRSGVRRVRALPQPAHEPLHRDP